MKIHLRPYQQQVIDEARELLQSHRAIIVTLSTGSGKSVIEAHILKLLFDNGNRGYLLTHRYEIMKQLIGHLIKQDVYPGRIISGERMTANKIQVAMVQTLFKKMKYLKDCWPDMILADENHHYCAPTFSQVINFKEETKVIGFSATPARTDGTGLINAGFTAMINGPQTYDLIKAGYLTPMVVLSSETTKLYREKKFKKKNKEYDENELTLFSSQKVICDDTVKVYKKYFNGFPAIIFCCSVADCELMASILRGEGWKAEALHEKIPMENRIKFLDGLGTGETQIICAYDIISEGVDIPILAGVIIRRLTCSLINWLQWVGRCLRKSPGKKNAIIIDQAGNIFQHGHPEAIREWKLEGEAKIKNESEITVKQCPSCSAWVLKNVQICPYCNEDLTAIKPEKPENIKIIHEPLIEIKPPEIEVGRPALDKAEIMEFDEQDLEQEIIDRIKFIRDNKENDIEDRFNILASYFGKSHKWKSEVWNKYFKNFS